MNFPAYLAFTSPVTLYRIIKSNGGFDPCFTMRVLILFSVSLLMLPFNWLERMIYGKQIDAKKISDSPLIIIGHDRSGTTHLLNLMSLDPQFAYTRPSQMVLPGCCILFDKIIDLLLGMINYKRPFDNMDVAPGSPQDDEVPMVKLTPHCEYHKYSFPRNYQYWLENYVFNFSRESQAYNEWRDTYFGTLKKAAVLMKRDRSLLKSPATMANLNVVLGLFPNAKFIHIKRNPYKVIPSQINLHRTMVDKYGLEKVSNEEIIEFALYQYAGYMQGFLDELPNIPKQNLIEISYEEFVSDRMHWLEKIYNTLALGDFSKMKKPLQDYIDTIENYQAHKFVEDKALKAQINEKLGFAFDALGYEMQQ